MALRTTDIDILNQMIAATYGIPGMGNAIWLDPTKGSDGNSGEVPMAALKSITAAYAKARTGYNDTILMVPGATGATVTSAITWSKTFTHLIGTHPGGMNNRCRISTSTASAGTLLTVSGQGCVMKNVLISQEGSHATGNAVALTVSGHRCYFENVGVRNIGALAVVDNSHRSLVLAGAYDITFKHCYIGEETYDASTATSAVIESTTEGGGKYMFEDCYIFGAGSANALFYKQGAFSNSGGPTIFKRTLLTNTVSGDMDPMSNAFNLGSGNKDTILFHSMVHGATAYEASDSGTLYVLNAQAAATGDSAVAATF